MDKLLHEIHEILDQTKADKKKNMVLLLEIAVEALKRCPSLADMPQEEYKEMLNILKEKDLI